MNDTGEKFIPKVADGERQSTYEETDKTIASCPEDPERKPIEKVYLSLRRTKKEGEAAGEPLDVEEDKEMGFLLCNVTSCLGNESNPCSIDNVLSPAECKYYIEQANAEGLTPVYGEGGYRKDYRNNDRVAVKSHEVADVIWSRIKDYLFDVHVEKDNEPRQRVRANNV